MDKEVKKLWVEALRSGEYKQGSNFLHSGDSFCCLGVLCDISNKHDWRKGRQEEVSDSSIRIYGDSASVLPKSVQEWAGLELKSPEISTPDGIKNLTDLNDRVDGLSFLEIADLIERYA